MTSLLEAECELYKDEDDSRILHQVYGDEADDGMPSTCYCGSDAVVATSYTRKDPGRLYLTCENVNDGDCHIWKWLDVAVTEELRDVQTQLRLVKEQAFECDQKLMKLQKVVCELSKKNAVLRNGFALRVCVMVAALLLVGFMRACIILHNMIVENERDGYTRIDISEFVEGDSTRTSQVETERPTNLNNMFSNRND